MKRRSRGSAFFEITPLIDVVFLLLIFFMVSTVFKRDELALLLELPKSSSGEKMTEAPKDVVFIELGTEKIAFNGKEITFNELDQGLQGLPSKKIPVDIRIDKLVKYERVVLLFDKLKENQFSNISLITEK